MIASDFNVVSIFGFVLASLTTSIVFAQGFGGEGYDQLRVGVDPGFPAQQATSDHLSLEINTCYAESPGTLKLKYENDRKQEKILTHAGFRSIASGLVCDGSAVVWGIDFANAGAIQVTPQMIVQQTGSNTNLNVELVSVTPENEREIIANAELSTGSASQSTAPQQSVTIDVPAAGFYELKLRAPKNDKPTVVGTVTGLELAGDAIPEARVMTIRSPRAGAVHCHFGSSKKPSDVQLAVIEVRIATSDQPGQYFPVTTPFGYFGSTWKNDVQRFGGVNFSVWSPTESAKAGDIPNLSRLLAYREDAVYTVFGHEGIGVKPIGENPWDQMKPIDHQVLAVRSEAGTDFDTYTSYFANFDTGNWELFASAQKKAEPKKPTSLGVGHFMEVLYPSPHMRRESQVRGWLRTTKGDWLQIDQISHQKYQAAKDMSHRRWGVTEDGWFYISTGGWYPNDAMPETIELPKKFLLKEKDRPKFLTGEFEKSLLELPIQFSKIESNKIKSDSAVIEFDVAPNDFSGSCVVYYGSADRATFPQDINNRNYPYVEKWKWDRLVDVAKVKGGKNTVQLKDLESGKEYWFRLLIKGNGYQVWSPQSQSFSTTKR